MPGTIDLVTTANSIFQRFQDNFPTLEPTVTYTLDDVPFEPPADASWVRGTFLPGESRQVSLQGKARFRTPGMVTFQVFSPVGLGATVARGIADNIESIYRSLVLNGITYQAPRQVAVGPTGRYQQINVTVPWWVDAFVP